MVYVNGVKDRLLMKMKRDLPAFNHSTHRESKGNEYNKKICIFEQAQRTYENYLYNKLICIKNSTKYKLSAHIANNGGFTYHFQKPFNSTRFSSHCKAHKTI